jgi:hypothetical protein
MYKKIGKQHFLRPEAPEMGQEVNWKGGSLEAEAMPSTFLLPPFNFP